MKYRELKRYSNLKVSESALGCEGTNPIWVDFNLRNGYTDIERMCER
ncbi:hypothetical protein AALA79_15705 [Lachnospiraceae bacterium 64-25]|mgnify:CR=1 FL=1|nr:hypothetical protein IMSAGC005_00487 [Lachnospiraceae bacterium]